MIKAFTFLLQVFSLSLKMLMPVSCHAQPSNTAPKLNFDSFSNAKITAAIGKSFPSFAAENEFEKITNANLKGKVV